MPKNKLDYREFNATLSQYRQFHKSRTAPELVNKKALYAARGAIRQTVRPSRDKIKESLMMNGSEVSIPIAALIINKQRKIAGKRGLSGPEMRGAITTLINQRVAHRAYLASGWIPSVKELAPLVPNKRGIPRNDPQASKIQHPKGSCKPARGSFIRSVAVIINSATAKKTTTDDPMDKFALPALQKALDSERASMEENIKEEMLKAAKRFGIKAH